MLQDGRPSHAQISAETGASMVHFQNELIKSLETTEWGCTFIGDLMKCFLAMLQEKDIPGASLNDWNPSELKVPELECWLACWGAP